MSLISRLLIGLLTASLALLSGCEVKKEGVKTAQVRLSLAHQDEAGRALSRSGGRNENLTQGVRTELVLAVPANTLPAKNYFTLQSYSRGLTNLLDSTVSLNLPLNTSLRLAVFRFRTAYSTTQLKAQLRNFDSYGFSAPITLSASQTDLTVEITIRPNGTPAVQVGGLNGTVSESGGQATFTVALATAPKEDVQIPLTVSDTSEGSVTPTLLTFTPVNWNVAQTLTVSGVDDQVDDNDVRWTIVLGALTSLDSDYNGRDPADVFVTTLDNDTAAILSVTSSTANGSYKAGDNVTISVNFSEAVKVSGIPTILLETGVPDDNATYLSGSGTDNLTFTYTVPLLATSSDLDYVNNASLSGVISSMADIRTTLTLPNPGTPGSLGANQALVIDTTAPMVKYVSSSSPDNKTSAVPHYKAGDNISVTVAFSETVYVDNSTGNPRIQLETGATDQYALFSAGNATDELIFTYQVVAGDNSTDLDYKATGSLDLNSGTIRDLAGNDAVLTLASPGASNSLGHNKALVIDTTAPTVTISGLSTKSGYPATGPGPYKSGETLSLNLRFSETVARTFPYINQLRFSGGSYAAYDNITCSSNCTADNLTHQVTGGTGNATITIFGLMDLAGNIIEETPNGQNSFLVDNTPPAVSVIPTACSRDLTLNSGELRITASDGYYLKSWKKSNDNSTPSAGTLDNLTVFSKSYDNNTLTHALDNATCTATEAWGGCARHIYAWFEDFVGNVSTVAVNSTNHDPVYATVNNVTSSNPDNKSTRFPYYTVGNSISINVILSEKVTVVGTPYIQLNTGPTSPKSVNFSSGSGTDNHTYNYTVAANDNSTDLAQDNKTIFYNGAVMMEDSLCSIDNLTLTTPGAVGSLSANKNLVVDTKAPVVQSFDVYDHDNTTFNQQLYADNVTVGFTLSATDDRGVSEYIVIDNKCTSYGFSGSAVTNSNQFIGSPLPGGGTNTNGTGWQPADNMTSYTRTDNDTALDCDSTSAQSGETRNVHFFVVDLAGNLSTVSNQSKDSITFDNKKPGVDYIALNYKRAKDNNTEPDNANFMRLGTTASNVATHQKYKYGNLVNSYNPDSYPYPLNVDQIKIKFNEPLKTTLTTNNGSSGNPGAACSGNFMISADNFSTSSNCRELGTPTSSDNQTWSINLIRLSNGVSTCPNHLQGGSVCKSGFLDNTTYTVKLTPLQDFSLNLSNSGDNITTNFLTTPRPRIDNSTPDNNSTKRSVHAAPQFVFTSYMDPNSFVAGSSVLVSCSPVPTAPDSCEFVPKLDFYNKTLTVHPKGKWPEGTTVTVTVKGGTDNGTNPHGAYTYLQGNCKTQGPGMRDANELTTGGTFDANLNQNCGEHPEERVFMKSDYWIKFTTRGSLDSGLKLHLTLDNNTLDHSDNGSVAGFQDFSRPNTSSYHPVTSDGRDNESNGSYTFDGSDDYLYGPTAAIPSGAHSVCAWVYPTRFPGTKITALTYGSGSGSSSSLLSLGYSADNQTEIEGGGSITGGTKYGLNRWTHLCATYFNSSSILNLYANGEKVGSTSASLSLGATFFEIGQRSGGSQNWPGRIDEVKVFERGLEPGEVFDLYFEESRNLEGYFPLAGNGNDYSGKNRNGISGSGTYNASEGWSGTSGQALSFSNDSGSDDIDAPFGTALHTTDFTYLAWGFPETSHNSQTAYKPLISSAEIKESTLSGLGTLEHPDYSSCSWSSKTADNVSMNNSGTGYSGVPGGDDTFGRTSPAGANLTTSLASTLDTGHGIKVKKITKHSDNSTFCSSGCSAATFNNISMNEFYFFKKESNEKFKLLKKDGRGFVNFTTLYRWRDNATLDNSLKVEFEVCTTYKTSLLGSMESSSNYMSNGGTTVKAGAFRGWFLEHHRHDLANSVHYQRFREFYTDNATDRNADSVVNALDCYDTYLLDPAGSSCPATTTLDDGTSIRNTVDYKSWQMLSARGYNTTLELLRNGKTQATNTSRNTNLRYSDNLTIGGIQDTSSYQYIGRVDDVRVYSRTLTDAEIKAIFTVVDLHPPTPGDNGTMTDNGTHLGWTAAKDDYTDNSSLKYRVVYYGNSNLIANAETALRNGTVVSGCDWQTGMIRCADNSTNRYYTILVRDQWGNIASYTTKHRN